MDKWPEGPAAEPEAARARYDSDLAAARKGLREAMRADLPAAHLGLGVVVVAAAILGGTAGPVAGALLAAAFAALFGVVRAVMAFRGIRGADAWRRSYVFTFGWANWF
ncbi:hypothetical protein [Streptomyces sp. NPDC049040]|uniref:hypothetical protein n=1 Tax=Streptomyces sp. NPDC049040 TaxID=3365593 RepID=UPI00371F16B3